VSPNYAYTDRPNGIKWDPPYKDPINDTYGDIDNVSREYYLFLIRYDHRYFWIEREISRNSEIRVFSIFDTRKDMAATHDDDGQYIVAVVKDIFYISPNLIGE
jgi:hypothetical protein